MDENAQHKVVETLRHLANHGRHGSRDHRVEVDRTIHWQDDETVASDILNGWKEGKATQCGKWQVPLESNPRGYAYIELSEQRGLIIIS